MLKIKKIKPMFTGIVTTGEKYSEDMFNASGLIESKKGDLKDYQTVVAVGPMVRDIKVGDKVAINVMNYAVRQYDPNSVKNDFGMNKVMKFAFNWVTVETEDDKPMECLLLQDRDILYVYEGEEVQGKKPSTIVTPENKKIRLN